MHDDFQLNLIRFNLLMKAESEPLKVDRLEAFFKDKELKNVTKDILKRELEHLHSENLLFKISEREYEISELGRQELKKLKKAIEKI